MFKKICLLILICVYSFNTNAQAIQFKPTILNPVNVYIDSSQINGKKVIKVIKDSNIKDVDEPTYVKINGIDFKNGIIKVKVLSKLVKNAPDTARGFIGIAFHINEDNSKFNGIYIRPTNGRALQQIRRNRSTQYFSYPDYKYNVLRTIAPGAYESYSDMELNKWIGLKIIVKDAQAILYLNDNTQPSLIVNDLKYVPNKPGSIGLFVDIGTEGYFTDLEIDFQK